MVNSCFAVYAVIIAKRQILVNQNMCNTQVVLLSVETMRLMVNTEKEKHKMFTAILAWFTQLSTQNYQTRLDQYIESHRPTSVAEVEYLERQYSKMNRGGLL
jgi:hypothetical protein